MIHPSLTTLCLLVVLRLYPVSLLQLFHSQQPPVRLLSLSKMSNGGDDEREEYGDQVDIVYPGGVDFEDPNEHAEEGTDILRQILRSWEGKFCNKADSSNEH